MNSRISKSSGAATTAEEMPPGLRHSDDRQPGFTRKAIDGGFAYFDLRGKRITDPEEIRRINALAIPPAYKDVWICPDERGHLQATGRDARGRKQYRYHPLWREVRDENKYQRMAAFGRALPRIRARVTRDLKRPGMPRDKVVAAIVKLLDATLIRVGSEEYARENGSYGLTTLRKKHVKVASGQVRFRFRGKSGIEHDVSIEDARVKRIVRRCAELPGHDLFKYIDETGERRSVGSADVNDYLREASGADFTAKDYRTWAGSVYALASLRRLDSSSATQARHHVVEMIKEVATLLRNTPAVCRRCYVHPAVVAAFEAGELSTLDCGSARRGLRLHEAELCLLLEQAEKRAAKLARQSARKPASRKGTAEPSADASLAQLLGKSRALHKVRRKTRRAADRSAPSVAADSPSIRSESV
ncbi:DNA topoisomerase-1 [Trinickia symbiotica]|uniref:DNA topoisomerase n=1 Tax=Trinickia symbiotica TaxID=863227 RepID=A0A2N7X2G7_9BURK|nr:DNA topoisomerase IB [Trinickia symbiotica]PMS35752.1 DNA topoisomerase [Trinickia symbiotica]PPK44630.1 DNA topoisomerase-1 [Trinickia symbiotica]